jgi:hypothetical protein
MFFRQQTSKEYLQISGIRVWKEEMAKRINFFATKNDMISVLSKLEEQFSYEIKYIQCGKLNHTIYKNVKEIPSLGTLKEKHGEISFLIMRKDDEVNTNRYGHVYQGDNLFSLEFEPSGISEDGTGLIHGIFAIMDDNEISVELFKVAKRIMKAEFRKSKNWYIGKEAEKLYGKLRFICIGLNEPELYDFRIESRR